MLSYGRHAWVGQIWGIEQCSANVYYIGSSYSSTILYDCIRRHKKLWLWDCREIPLNCDAHAPKSVIQPWLNVSFGQKFIFRIILFELFKGTLAHACHIRQYSRQVIVMAALCNRGHYIFALWFLSVFFYLSFFPRLISAATDWMSTILLHMAWP